MLRYLRSLPLALAAASLLAPAAAHAAPAHKKVSHASAKKAATSKAVFPSVSKVSPLKAGVGDKLVLKGKSFRSGKGKNFIIFKRDGGRALFVKADKATTKQITVVIPAKILTFLVQKSGVAQPTRFKLRVSAKRLGKSYTKAGMSPLISATAGATGTADDCDGDGVTNAKDSDDDNDLLSDSEEARLGTDPCKRDSDGDGMSDGWEQQSAIDRNGGGAVPSPKTKPYPNALNKDDANVDSDGDGLTNLEEYTAWATFGGNKVPLNYSGGNPASGGRGGLTPEQSAYWDRDQNGYLTDFERDADGDGIPNMDETISDVALARLTVGGSADDPNKYDFGIFTDAYTELAVKATGDVRCSGVNQVPFYCLDQDPFKVVVKKVDPLDWVSADTDGDTIPDAADDQDHDDVSNIDEWHTYFDTKGWLKRHYGPADACFPDSNSRFCVIGGLDIDRDGLINAVDADDDGDLVPDVNEVTAGTNPLLADTDGDGVSDGFEYYSAETLNGAAPSWPSSRPLPNPTDKSDANVDFDGDSLTLLEEYKAWLYTYCPGDVGHCKGGLPLTYNDGTQYSGGKTPATGALTKIDEDGNGVISDDEKDVDNDYLSNFVETHGPLSDPGWYMSYANDERNKCDSQYVESLYPTVKFTGLDFVNPDTDGDGTKDGQDDVDHDGYTNWFETWRPGMSANRTTGIFSGPWCATYTSSSPHGPGTHTNDLARVNPFNPCKPTYSDYCHTHPLAGYYGPPEDWRSTVSGTLAIPYGTQPWE